MKNCIEPFFLSDVMRMCRIPSGKIIKENIHAAFCITVEQLMIAAPKLKTQMLNNRYNYNKAKQPELPQAVSFNCFVITSAVYQYKVNSERQTFFIKTF